ncbi:CRISPR-associated protein Cas4 [Acetonema longum]|uniref:CRISPR-associated exonuclease Cas4 n=1 Tax=Acetonema longum DSM 6540 TaxID=1009370 RepID=F7NGQ5_9FIRM|nr:CRISPR-associated protein Cas4 [Acetonema longum]EGO64859.1 CRISPR-associated exonuclease, Cas4 family protein [Acetonema longum DSM 6540]
MRNFETEKKYSDDDLLLLSGIQHIAFCERQWALIHLEQVWAENVRTVEGKHLHERADDPYKDETRKTLRVIRAMPLVSYQIGLRGVADVVEFHQSQEVVSGEMCRLEKREGWWRPVPVEYKRGRPKPDDRDAVQLCAQAMALEEMMVISIPSGFLFYGQTKHRESVFFDIALRQHTVELATRMHQLAREEITPKPQKGKHCSQCSLVEQCQPQWMLRHRSVESYLARMCHVEVDHS